MVPRHDDDREAPGTLDSGGAHQNYPGAMETQPATFPPPNWTMIPQKDCDHEPRPQDFRPSEDISFAVNGRPGVNLKDAHMRTMDLDGRDAPMLRWKTSGGGIGSCFFSVRLSR